MASPLQMERSRRGGRRARLRRLVELLKRDTRSSGPAPRETAAGSSRKSPAPPDVPGACELVPRAGTPDQSETKESFDYSRPVVVRLEALAPGTILPSKLTLIGPK